MKFHLSPSDLFRSDVKLKIIKFLLTHEAPMSEREIASVLKISHMSVNRTMQDLAELNLVHYVTVGKAHLWKVHQNSYAYRMFERLVKNMEVIVDPLGELKQTILKHIPLKLVERLMIFGSIGRESETSNSDIDLFILLKNADGQKKIEEAVDKLSNECLEIFGNRLSPYILTIQQYKQKEKLNIIDAINQGIQIYGSARLTTGPNGKPS